MEGVTAVSYTESWPFRVCNLLTHGTEDMTPGAAASFPKVNVEEYLKTKKRARTDLNEEIILNHVLLYLIKHRYWPAATTSGEVEGLPNETWSSWNSSLTSGSRGFLTSS